MYRMTDIHTNIDIFQNKDNVCTRFQANKKLQIIALVRLDATCQNKLRTMGGLIKAGALKDLIVYKCMM